ncbi:exonuclease domain-containing protein [Enteractinococcus fodinae]|uniref:DNA polymerase-3 subunit epsilon n=1 Tax=Enteractinococcus fodinae TaxID=684663 RepID=A0ABU2AYH8_9MICC|nr:exonuclease domain-containing protein [Enteractinococcus fodinae]MDR7346096.1 DNA polymerase-3 subunit epsilon [Enteractinococcus fodinae]
MSQLSFLALDFETANPDQASVCQVGVAKVVNGAIVESDSWLVTPPTGIESFEPRFIRIHGIIPKQVRRSGISWQASLDRLLRLADGLPVVAHNISFDRTVFRRASERVGVSVPSTQWFDTLSIARRFVKAPNHRLPTVAKALDLPAFQHHQAEADAITCARIAIVLSQRHQLTSVSELWQKPTARRRSPVPARRFVRVGDLPAPNSEAHPEHPLYGHHVVITGDLHGVNRDDFIVKIAELGAQPQLNVTKKTTMLVVANQEHFPTHYDPAAGSAKEKKAHEYRLAGQQIDFVPAQQALAMLATNVEEPEDVVADVPEPVVESPALKPSEVILPTPPLIRHQCQLAHVPAASGVLGFLLRSFDQ